MKSDEKFVEGIDLSKMTEDEIKNFTDLVDTFYENLQPYIKAHYRRFDRQKMTG